MYTKLYAIDRVYIFSLGQYDDDLKPKSSQTHITVWDIMKVYKLSGYDVHDSPTIQVIWERKEKEESEKTKEHIKDLDDLCSILLTHLAKTNDVISKFIDSLTEQ